MQPELGLVHAAFDRAVHDVTAVHEELVSKHQTLDDRVRAMLGAGWRGVAAEEYRDGWSEWNDGVELVLRGLFDLSEAMSSVHDDLSATDADQATPIGRLNSRLGGLA